MAVNTCSLHQSWAKSYWSGCGSVCKAATGDKMEKEYLNFPPAPSFPLAPDYYSPPLECPLPPPLHQDTQDTDVPIDHCTEARFKIAAFSAPATCRIGPIRNDAGSDTTETDCCYCEYYYYEWKLVVDGKSEFIFLFCAKNCLRSYFWKSSSGASQLPSLSFTKTKNHIV